MKPYKMRYNYWQLAILLIMLHTSVIAVASDTIILNSADSLKSESNELPSELLEILTLGLEADGNDYYKDNDGWLFYFNRINKLPPIIAELFPSTIFFYSGVIASTYGKGNLGAYHNGEIKAPVNEFNMLVDSHTTMANNIEALLYFKEGFDVEINNIKHAAGENNKKGNRCIHIKYNIGDETKGINLYLDGNTFLYYQCTDCYNTVAKVYMRR